MNQQLTGCKEMAMTTASDNCSGIGSTAAKQVNDTKSNGSSISKVHLLHHQTKKISSNQPAYMVMATSTASSSCSGVCDTVVY